MKAVIAEFAQERLAVYRRHPESEDKQNRLRYADDVLSYMFSSQNWWLEQQYKEVKSMLNQITCIFKG